MAEYAPLPGDKDESTTGMNVLAPDAQQAGQQMESEAPGGAVGVSGTQSSTVGGGAAQKAPQGPPKAGGAKKQARSGMFTNIRKYTEANKPQASKMAQAGVQHVQKQAGQIQKQVGEQQKSFADQVAANRARMKQAQTFGQESVQKATGAESQEYLQAEQAKKQARLGTFQDQNLQAGGQLTTQQSTPYAGKTAADYDKEIADYWSMSQEERGSGKYVGTMDKLLADKASAAAAQTAYTQKTTGLQEQLATAQGQQQLYGKQQEIQAELDTLQQRMNDAPETLTAEDYNRFRGLVEGKERFDQAVFNIEEQQRSAEALGQRGRDIEKGDVRRQLLRESVGGRGYSRGESLLDELIVQTSPEAREQLVSGVRGAAAPLAGELREATRAGKQEMGLVGREGQALREELQTSTETGLTGLKGALQEKLASGEGSLVKRVQESLASGQGIDPADMAALGLTGQESLYNLDPSQLFDYDASKYGVSDIATGTDVTRAKALSQLAGKDQTLIDEQVAAREISAGDTEAIKSFKDQLGARKVEFEQAEKGILDGITYGSPGTRADEMKHLGPSILAGAKQGKTYDINNPDDKQQLQQMASSNYWAWAGQGQHGINIPLHVIARIANEATQNYKGTIEKFTPERRTGGEGLYEESNLGDARAEALRKLQG